MLHANWTDSALHLWGERLVEGDAGSPAEAAATRTAQGALAHPGAMTAAELKAVLAPLAEPAIDQAADGTFTLRMPVHTGPSGSMVPVPSPRAAHTAGLLEEDGAVMTLDAVVVPAIVVPPAAVPAALSAIDKCLEKAADEPATCPFVPGAGVEFFITADRFCQWLLVQQRFVPALVQDIGGGVRGLWQPWLADDYVAQRATALLKAMPPACRAVIDPLAHDPWSVLEDFLVRVCDARCRAVMTRENMIETIESRCAKPGADEDPHVTWLGGLLEVRDDVSAVGQKRTEMLKRVRSWIGVLDQRSSDSAWRLCLKLVEPVDLPGGGGAEQTMLAPADALKWSLSFHLQSIESPAITISAADLWVLPTDGAMVSGKRVEQPQELLLAELGRAARVYRPLEEALKKAEPADLALSTAQAYEFLREHRQLLLEQGFGVLAPAWWDSPAARLGVRLKIDSPDSPAFRGLGGGGAGGAGPVGGPAFGLHTLVNYRWQISLGATSLSLDEFEKLASSRSPLVYIGGQWVEVRPDDIKAAVEFIRGNPGGEIEIGKAIRMAYGADSAVKGVSVVGVDTTGWVSSLLGGTGTSEQQKNFSMPMLGPPPGFIGSLRPYQVKGLSWLAFLDRLGLGTCLADDMGLGKTIQLLAMLLHERAPEAAAIHGNPGPTLLVVPMSVVGNWVRETRRFAPSLRVLVHHGLERQSGQTLRDAATSHDLVVTTYALAHRDREDLEAVPWWRVALDEAQNIKNPQAKQTQAVRGIDSLRRVALTGTPVENRLSELWSIMDFLNPGLLGGAQEFRSRYSLPIEKYNDVAKARQLRGMVQPFVLRRLKTDPQVIADLPEKVETKEFCYLTPEQAALYEQTVKQMLGQAEAAGGIQRRGLILAGLMKLKQICNHPAQYKGAPVVEGDEDAVPAPSTPAGLQAPSRSGKCTRIVQMLDEVIASGGQALVFTQFRVMGEMLAAMLRHELDREVLLLHGGTSQKDREELIARFQKGDGSAPIFVLSLKAGGIGLNLTAANHVFHFDRWWNPAVENQATDRAFRIGQTRTVQVHKFVVAGTLEEKIDQMIESKAGLADNVIGSGESWLTELNLNQLRDVLTLRQDAVEAEVEA
ncbi:MAG: DEAD/DEAH box helicase [Phycisphaerales bacterium]